MNAEDFLLFVDEYVCGMPKKKKSTTSMLVFVTVSLHCVSWSLIHIVTNAMVRFLLGPGFGCLACGEGHWEWWVEVQWKLM